MSKKIAKNKRIMETGDHFKNGASPKSQMNKRNFLKRFALLSAGLAVFGRKAGAQEVDTKGCGCTITKTPLRAGSNKPMQITNVFVGSDGFLYDYPEEFQGYLRDYIKAHPQNNLENFPKGYLYSSNDQKPFYLVIDTQVIAPVKVKYALYTYKKTFSQDGKRNSMNGITSCYLEKPLTTQEDINNALDKIYEFPVVMETASGQKGLSWNGYTDPKFTGQKYAVRDCLYIAAHNADKCDASTGVCELIDIQGTTAAQIYQSATIPGIVYRIDKDSSGKETLSGKVLVAYPDSWPIKKITALITTSTCIYGPLPFETINQGADAIVADINERLPGYVIARITLTNPTVDKNNKNIKIFDWKDIKTQDGKDFIPDLAKNSDGYMLALIIEIDEMTFTGIKNGFIALGHPSFPPVPRSSTANEEVEKSEIRIISNETGFVVLCPSGVLAKSYAVYDMVGRTLKTGSLSGLSRETITALELRSGVYFVHLQVSENGAAKTVTKKVVR